jgi:hypothetical protein
MKLPQLRAQHRVLLFELVLKFACEPISQVQAQRTLPLAADR